jgi:DNA-binding NarL/FixJ family response regulator
MARRHLKVLLIEDNPGDVRLIQEMLAEAKGIAFHLESTDSLSGGMGRLTEAQVDLLLLDLSLPDGYGIETFRKAYAQAPGVPIVVLSGSDDEELAMHAVQAGAQDYLVKGQVDGHLLARAILYAVERERGRKERLQLLAREQAARDHAAQAEQRLHDIVHVVRDAKGPVRQLRGVMMDITAHKQVEEELKSRARQQAAVAEFGQRALANPPLAELFDEVVALVANTLDVEYCSVLQLLPDGKALRLQAGIGWKPGLVGHALVDAGTDSQAGYTLLAGEPVIVEDLHTEPRFRGTQLLHDHGVVSGLDVIIYSSGKPCSSVRSWPQWDRFLPAWPMNSIIRCQS